MEREFAEGKPLIVTGGTSYAAGRASVGRSTPPVAPRRYSETFEGSLMSDVVTGRADKTIRRAASS
ncbi:MAG TPA: hypothetical protein VLY46_12990 [Usitatibacter sp.]|nr:hypothetical protein [Usitatibacter sp.]